MIKEEDKILSDNEVKMIQTFMLNELTKYLDYKKIPYYVIAGTLLGAVRHEGFIPWDDDIDIAIKRNDYNRFLEIFNEFDNDIFFLQNWHTEKDYGLPFSKLKLNNSIYREKVTKNLNIHQGIFIDIFPYDEVSGNKFTFYIQKNVGGILQKLIVLKSNYNLEKDKSSKSRIQSLAYKMLFLFKKSILIKLFEYIVIQSNNSDSDYYVCTGGSYGFKKEMVKKAWFKESIMLNFEGCKVSGPLKYVEYLKNLYGNYLELPPEEKRISRHKIQKKEISLEMLALINEKKTGGDTYEKNQ